jgi:hypothetical protein
MMQDEPAMDETGRALGGKMPSGAALLHGEVYDDEPQAF